MSSNVEKPLVQPEERLWSVPPAPKERPVKDWTRKRGQAYKTGMKIVALRSVGLEPREIWKKLGISRQYYYELVARLKTAGEWVEASADRLAIMGVPLAVDNAIYHLEKRDKRMTIEMLKGHGILKEDSIGGSVKQQVLAVKIELPSGGSIRAAAGTIVGAPNTGELEG